MAEYTTVAMGVRSLLGDVLRTDVPPAGAVAWGFFDDNGAFISVPLSDLGSATPPAPVVDAYTRAQTTALLAGKQNAVVVGAGSVVKFDAYYEYPPIVSGTFTVDTSKRDLGMEATIYLGPGATAPTLDPVMFQLVAGAYQAGVNLMYTFKVGVNGKIQYVISELP